MWPYVILLVCPLLVQHVRVKGEANGLSSDRKIGSHDCSGCC